MPTQPKNDPSPATAPQAISCLHGRLIDDVLTKDGQRTGKVRCLECGAIIDDPYHGLK